MKQNYISLVLLLIIAGLAIWYFFFRKEPTPTQTVSYEYVTDTVYIDRIIKVKVPTGISTSPQTVLVYKTDSSVIDSLNIELKNKQILLSSLMYSVSLHQSFITQFPTNPKLLSLALYRDSLSLGLLNTKGEVTESMWPIDLNKWYYTWDNESDLLRYSTNIPKPDKPFLDFYMGGGFDMLWVSPYVSASVEKNISRIRLYGNAQLGLLKNEVHGLKIGIDYRINGKSTNRKR